MHIAKISLTLILAMGLTAAHAQFAGEAPPDGSSPPDGGGAPSSTVIASGTLTDSSIQIGYFYNDLTTALASSTVTVGSAVEVSCPDTALDLCASTNATGNGLLDGEYIDVGSTTISGQFLAPFTAESGDTFNGLVFSGLNFGDGYALTGFTLSTNISGLDASALSFTASSLSMNLLGIDPSVTTDGTSLGTFSITLQVSAVPEPSSALLSLLGLSLLVAIQLRRQRTQR